MFSVHVAKNCDYHAFHGEVRTFQQAALGRISLHVVYSKPRVEDSGLYDSVGSITPDLLAKIVPDLGNADFYMC